MELANSYSVYVSAWEIECCGTPPAVDQEVEWQLALHPVSDRPNAEIHGDFETDLRDGEVDEVPAPHGSYALIREGGLVARLPRGAAPVGVLHEGHHDTHSAGAPATRGVVKRVRVVTGEPRRPDRVIWEHETESIALTDVDVSPKHFKNGEDGVLVDLAVGTD